MKLAMIGTGYVGLTTGACFARVGHDVICVDSDSEKIETLNKGGMPIFEPGLDEIIKEAVSSGRLEFTTDVGKSVRESSVCFIAVGTPTRDTGEPDLGYVENVARDIAENMNKYHLVVEKSTVPVQTHRWVRTTIERYNKAGTPFDVASNPEFLREGSAVDDFLHPDRIVVGVESDRARKLMEEVYAPFDAPLVITDLASAELIKHASNAFLAMKISFANALSVVCEASGADVRKVTEGMGMDNRIGPHFLNAGVGYGGFCFPKDLRAFVRIADELGYDFALLREVENINGDMKRRFVRKVKSVLWNLRGKKIGVLGLSFKPNTDDMRFAPSIDIINELVNQGAVVSGFDPKAMERAKTVIPGIRFCDTPQEVADDADLLALLTEWPEFGELDLADIKRRMRVPILCDGRNFFERDRMEELGFTYLGVGR
ncbi:MAG: UDP-glucose/GDP-mannose dehydrogenase family protein [candidate division WOR-3 bacterium]|nr:MAG: UDP-glucose/GDP-mannose dehydrogenase family protein [candidate division WOR-3 bacterium]